MVPPFLAAWGLPETQRGRVARPAPAPVRTDARDRYAPNFWANCFTIASASGSAIIRMCAVADRSVV